MLNADPLGHLLELHTLAIVLKGHSAHFLFRSSTTISFMLGRCMCLLLGAMLLTASHVQVSTKEPSTVIFVLVFLLAKISLSLLELCGGMAVHTSRCRLLTFAFMSMAMGVWRGPEGFVTAACAVPVLPYGWLLCPARRARPQGKAYKKPAKNSLKTVSAPMVLAKRPAKAKSETFDDVNQERRDMRTRGPGKYCLCPKCLLPRCYVLDSDMPWKTRQCSCGFSTTAKAWRARHPSIPKEDAGRWATLLDNYAGALGAAKACAQKVKDGRARGSEERKQGFLQHVEQMNIIAAEASERFDVTYLFVNEEGRALQRKRFTGTNFSWRGARKARSGPSGPIS